MSSSDFVALNQRVKDLCDLVNALRAEMDTAYRHYRTTPSAIHYTILGKRELEFQQAYQELTDARCARREFLRQHNLCAETHDAGDGRRVTIPAD